MPLSSLTESTLAALRRYTAEIAKVEGEAQKVGRFIALLAEVFGEEATRRYVNGMEHGVRVNVAGTSRRRAADAFSGNAVIEFERSLKRSQKTAEAQLREQCAGVWNAEGKQGGQYRSLLAVATDGLVWMSYNPVARDGAKGQLSADDVALEPVRTITLTRDNPHVFWFWLTGWLLREGNIEPSADRFRLDFGTETPTFHLTMKSLRAAWEKYRDQQHGKLSIDTWARYLTITYGFLGKTKKDKFEVTPEIEDLFLKHTYLACIARLLVWAALTKGRGKDPKADAGTAASVLTGRAFETLGVRNMVEDDFFHWIHRPGPAEVLMPSWEALIEQLRTYDLTRIDQDILKGVYQDLVDPKDRHELGEYYTPEWLCEKVTDATLPPTGFHSVLDPSCGSGSFLRAAIAHMLAANPKADPELALEKIIGGVAGIDIHPLAVTIARATYLLAIQKLLKPGTPVQVPVYMADALFVPREVGALFAGTSMEVNFEDKRVVFPASIVKDPELFDAGIHAATKVAEDHAKTRAESHKTLAVYIKRHAVALHTHPDGEKMTAALWDFADKLAALIRADRDSIWSFIVRNTFRPAMLAGRFDFILGNPPWLSYRYISDPEYQERVKQLAVGHYQIAPPDQHLLTQMELATLFLVHVLQRYGTKTARLGFVMPRSILSAAQHTNWRTRQYRNATSTLDAYWDLMDVRPLFNVPTCAVFASNKGNFVATDTYSVPARTFEGRLPDRNLRATEADRHLTVTDGTGRLIWMGEQNALDTGSGGAAAVSAGSPYADLFTQGATLVPRNFYFVTAPDMPAKPDPDGVYWCATDQEQAKEAKEPWKAVRMEGEVEGRFFFTTIISKHVLPFYILPPADVVLPVDVLEPEEGVRGEGGRRQLVMVKPDDLRKQGFRAAAKWFGEVERKWQAGRGAKSDQSANEWLDWSGKLTCQDPAAPFRVVYNAAGTDVSAARVPTGGRFDRLIVEHKLYHMACRLATEAAYVAAVLNSMCLNDAIKPFQSRGLMGPRDVEKKVLELPIPMFDAAIGTHRELADLGAAAAAKVAAANLGQMPGTLAKRRAAARTVAGGELGRIDAIVQRLLST